MKRREIIKNTITKNAAKCLRCKEVVESKHRHDYQTCKCGNVSVDGGLDYLRRAVVHIELWEDKSECKSK